MTKSSSVADGPPTGEPPTGEPPPGPPWDEPLERAALAFLDFEMTGLDPAADRIIQLCVERVQGEVVVERLASYVQPDVVLPAGGVPVCGITAGELAGAPRFGELAEPLLGLLSEAVVVAHAAAHDMAFLRAELARLGRPWIGLHHLDTVPLARQAFDSLPSHRLVDLAAALGIAHPTPHRADADVAALRGLFARVVAELAPATARDLWRLGHPSRLASATIVAAAQRAAAGSRPMRVSYRPSGRRPEQLCFRVTAVRTDLDPPRVLGYLHDTRGRRELRVPRILAIEPWDDEC
ncbi:MAG: 3'-5' exonuclease [Deltaproteobacteria bacterium]|nr:3'-5' exonuclease [Deltaproteobacteria bacterium]